jgi:hypothetical protein
MPDIPAADASRFRSFVPFALSSVSDFNYALWHNMFLVRVPAHQRKHAAIPAVQKMGFDSVEISIRTWPTPIPVTQGAVQRTWPGVWFGDAVPGTRQDHALGAQQRSMCSHETVIDRMAELTNFGRRRLRRRGRGRRASGRYIASNGKPW